METHPILCLQRIDPLREIISKVDESELSYLEYISGFDLTGTLYLSAVYQQSLIAEGRDVSGVFVDARL